MSKTTEKKKQRDFFFTITVFDEGTEERLQSLPLADQAIRYLLYTYEIGGDTGRPHFHGYIYFNSARYFNPTVKLLFGKNDKGDVQFAKDAINVINYCTKEAIGGYFEYGVRPLTDAEKGKKEIDRFQEARQAARERRFDDIPADIYVRYQSSLKRIAREDCPKPANLEPRQTYGVWIWGPTHTGKSYHARMNYSPLYLKDKNKWWDDYAGEDNVLIDEFEPSDAQYLTGFMKRWVDRWTFRAEYKGGSCVIRPQQVIVTSNFSIEDCFFGRSDIEAIKRRFVVVHLTEVYQL